MVHREQLGLGVGQGENPWIAPGWAVEAHNQSSLDWPVKRLTMWARIAEEHGSSAISNNVKDNFDFIYLQALAGSDWAQQMIDKATPRIVIARMLK